MDFLSQIGASDNPFEISLVNKGDLIKVEDDPIFGDLDQFFLEDAKEATVISQPASFDFLGAVDTITGLANFGFGVFQGVAAIGLARDEQDLKEDIAKAQIAIQREQNKKQIELIDVQIKSALQSVEFQGQLASSQISVQEAQDATKRLEERLKQTLLEIQIESISPPEINLELEQKLATAEIENGVKFTENERNTLKEQLLDIHFPELKDLTDLTVKDGQITSVTQSNKNVLFVAGAAALIGSFLLFRR